MGLMKIFMPGVDTAINNVVAAPKIESVVSEDGSKDPALSPFTDVFQCVGFSTGEYNFQLNKDVLPVVHPPRRLPAPKGEAMKTELDKMVADKIIIPFAQPTAWVSSVLAVPKKDGSVGICLDPKD